MLVKYDIRQVIDDSLWQPNSIIGVLEQF